MTQTSPPRHDVVIIGGGAAGISIAHSLLKRRRDLDIAIVEPEAYHFYQPGWTLVGNGTFSAAETRKPMQTVMPSKARWYMTRAQRVHPEANEVELEDGQRLAYTRLVVAAGLVLDWGAIEGLEDSLGQHGVTSNYHFDLAPYTWSQVQSLKKGTALFTQPPMPIKCAGAPQKAMYLSCDYWRQQGCLANIEVKFCNAAAALFGVADYVPALQDYIERYAINVAYQHRLVAVDMPSRTARFVVAGEDGEDTLEQSFDLLHVVPPQKAPAFIAESGLADAAGWLELHPATLQHVRHPAVFGLGDASGTANAKTAAAVRKQVPVVAENLLASLDDKPMAVAYLGYGACPLTVERGRVVLAEFGYGGQLQPTFPSWMNNGTQASRRAWWLKARLMPWLYWNGMLKGHEWLVRPTHHTSEPPAM